MTALSSNIQTKARLYALNTNKYVCSALTSLHCVFIIIFEKEN